MKPLAYVATFVVLAPLFVFFTVEVFKVSRQRRDKKWDNIYFTVLAILLFIVLAVSAIGFVRISTAITMLLPGTEQGHAPGAVGVDAVVPDRVALHE